MNNAIKWGGIMGVSLIIMNLLFYLTGMSGPGGGGLLTTIFSYVISIGSLVMGMLAFKKANNGYISFGEGLGQAMLIALVGGIIMAIWTFIFMSYIDTSAADQIREATEANMGELSEAEEDVANSIMGFITSPILLAGATVVMKLFLGLIVGLITAVVIKQERPYDSETL